MTQILRGQQATLTLAVYSDGTQTDQGTFTVGVVDASGNQVIPPGTAVTDNGDGTYEVTLPAQPDVKHLTVTWTEQGGNLTFVTHAEIVGGFLFTEAQARGFQDDRLTSEAKFTDDEIAAERVRITDWLETETGRSWIPRYRKATLRGTGSHEISLLNTVRSTGPSGGEGALGDIQKIITINGDPVADADVDIDGWRIYWDAATFTYSPRPNITIEYEYGLPSLRNGVDRIALLELADRLPASRRSRNTTQASDDLGTVTYWQPQNNGRPSRVPDVNAWVRAQDQRIPIA